MLNSDEIIKNVLTNEKQNGNKLLQKFHIQYPDKNVARESNSIFIASVSSEPSTELFEATEYRDLVEVLVVTKIKDPARAKLVIKTVIREIIRILKKSADEFPTQPKIRNIAPEYNSNFVLSKGHIMVEVLTEIVDDDIPIEKVCDILFTEVEEEVE